MITKEAIHSKIEEILRDELFFDGEFSSETRINDLGLDSIQFMQLLVYLEESFEFEFLEDSTLENLQNSSLSDFIDFIFRSIVSIENQ